MVDDTRSTEERILEALQLEEPSVQIFEMVVKRGSVDDFKNLLSLIIRAGIRVHGPDATKRAACDAMANAGGKAILAGEMIDPDANDPDVTRH